VHYSFASWFIHNEVLSFIRVKFDLSFPYGDNHEAFTAFSQQISNKTLTETTDHPDVIVATVGIKDYGDLENKRLAERYDVKAESFPVIKLFNNGNLEQPIDFILGNFHEEIASTQ
jgi:hypothetical protein